MFRLEVLLTRVHISQNHNNDTMPHKWPVVPFNNNWTASIFASLDPVALESMLLDLYQLDDDIYQYPKRRGVEDYLVEAALANNPPSGIFYDPNHNVASTRLASLGVFEHWNNSNDRKYSRNLGTGNGIELTIIEGSTAIMSHYLPTITPSLIVLSANANTIQFTNNNRFTSCKLYALNGSCIATMNIAGKIFISLTNPIAPGTYCLQLIGKNKLTSVLRVIVR